MLRTTRLLALVLATLPAAAARAQDAESVAVIEATGETLLSDFLDRMSSATGKTILYDPRGTRIANQTIGAAFRHEVPAPRLFDTYRAILSFYELTLIPVGPEGHEVHLVLDSRSSNNLVRNKTLHVPYEELESYADRDGLYITCVIPVQHIENLTVLRTGLSTMLTGGGLGRIHEIPGSHTLIVADFAPTVAAMARMVREADRPTETAQLSYLALDHADAREMAEVVTRLLSTPPTPQRAPQPYTPGPEPARVVAWEHGNALVISAPATSVERIRGLVSQLDTPVSSERVTRILALREAGARYAAAVIASALKDCHAEGGVAADERTNSVIVSADKATVEALRELIQALEEICRTL